MRKEFSTYIETAAATNENLVFITGDLGFNALEQVREAMGERFINAGVAEQNMLGMAAGMAAKGFQVICYSIAPFAVFRCFEQIRNDVCFHNLPVYIVGNGGGYGYGIMGSSHHALEDIGCLSGLPNMCCYVPAFVDDLTVCLDDLFERKQPAYLRLGLGKKLPASCKITSFGTESALHNHTELTIISQGPVSGNVLDAVAAHELAENIQVFTINKMPLTELPAAIIESIRQTRNVLTVEEHIRTGGLGAAVSQLVHENNLTLNRFSSLCATGYPNGLYGSQNYHLELCGLDVKGITQQINSYFANVYDTTSRS
jgi:transketolase